MTNRTPALLLAGMVSGADFAPVAGDPDDEVELPQAPEAVFRDACATCHGQSGRGAPADHLGFDLALPDFTDCNFAPREADADWVAVASYGGPVRAFSRMMPAMGDALTEEEIQLAIDHIRRFCGDPAWPRGELNLPRPIFTTKAYPEDEIVVDTIWDSTSGNESVTSTFLYEQRFGKRSQVELILPYTWRETSSGWAHGIDDVGIGLKSALLHDHQRGYIFSPGIEVFLPTGDDSRGIGAGTAVFEPYVAYGQILGRGFFLQAQAGVALPWDGADANEEIFARAAFGRAISEGGYGRRWTPMVELLYADELGDGNAADWDLAPQLQVTLSTRQHVRLGVGARIPLNDTGRRDPRFAVYLLWDWFDGGFFEGW